MMTTQQQRRRLYIECSVLHDKYACACSFVSVFGTSSCRLVEKRMFQCRGERRIDLDEVLYGTSTIRLCRRTLVSTVHRL